MQNNTSREVIYNALFSVLQRAYPWNYSSRRLLLWDNVTTGMQPAMFMRQHVEIPDQGGGNAGLTRWHLKVHIWVYIQAPPNADEPGSWPAQLMNPILDALEKALSGSFPGESQTLATINGGIPLVERVWIDGTIMLNDPVAPDQQIVMVVPVTITTGF